MAGAAELPPGRLVARAIVNVASAGRGGLPRVERLLQGIDARWETAKAIRQSTHSFDARANAVTCNGSALHLAHSTDMSREELVEAAEAYGEMLDGELRAPLCVPTARLSLPWAAMTAYVTPLFIAMGLPLGAVGAAMLDWTGVGLHRGIVQVFTGLYADATTVEVGPVGGYFAKLAFITALLRCENVVGPLHVVPPDGAWEEEMQSSMPRLEAALGHLCGSIPGVTTVPGTSAPDALVFAPGAFGTPMLRHAKHLRGLKVLGGGVRRHEFDVTHLQRVRRFAHVVWTVWQLRVETALA